MSRGGPNRGQGRKPIVLEEVEEWAIAAEVFRRRWEIAAERVELKRQRDSVQQSAYYTYMKNEHRRVADLRLTMSSCSPDYQEACTRAKQETSRWLRARGAERILCQTPKRPKLSATRCKKLYAHIAKWATHQMDKPISRTRVEECWKRHSAMFNDCQAGDERAPRPDGRSPDREEAGTFKAVNGKVEPIEATPDDGSADCAILISTPIIKK